MSRTNKHKVFIVAILVALAALGVSLVRGRPLLAIAAGQAQSLESDTLFFAGDSPTSIYRLPASEPGQMAGRAAAAAAESVPLAAVTCDVFGLHSSPNGRWIAVDVGCAAGAHTLLFEVAAGRTRPAAAEPWPEGLFLNWAPDGDSFLLQVGYLGESAVLLINAQTGQFEQVDTPPFTYDAAFSPDGGQALYAVSRGLGFGSEVWIMDRGGRNREQVVNDPAHVIAYPRWSPTGDGIAYIRLPDSNIPFTVGELVLADGNGRSDRVIASADAGHGYPPVWSPDGRQVAFVARENPDDKAADVAAPYLESNIYLADAATGGVRAVTRFEGALIEGPAWSPDGAWLAFSSDAGGAADVWLVEVASGETQQVTQGADARYPVWLADAR